jgi:hypothetical protein
MVKTQSLAVTGPRSKRTASRNSSDERIASACRVQVPIDGLDGPVDSLAPIDGDRAVEKERFSYRQTSVRHVRLKCRGKDSAHSFCHNCSCAAASSPLSGRSSTYRPVRIWPTTSVDSRDRRVGEATVNVAAGMALKLHPALRTILGAVAASRYDFADLTNSKTREGDRCPLPDAV